MMHIHRREYLRKTAAVAIVGTVATAGCLGNDDVPDNDTPFVDDEPDYEGWFDDVPNYEATHDFTDENRVTVLVGAGDGLRYDPPAIQVSAGTTVVWEWTGEGGNHDVAETDGAFQSELTAQAGHTFEHTFQEEGIYTYFCTPHRAVGMKGAVSVV